MSASQLSRYVQCGYITAFLGSPGLKWDYRISAGREATHPDDGKPDDHRPARERLCAGLEARDGEEANDV